MARLNVKQREVAAAAGIPTSTFSDLINDKKQFDIEQLDDVCFALDLPLADTIRSAELATMSRHAEGDATTRRLS